MQIAGNGRRLEVTWSGWKEGQTRREAMNEILPAHGTNFPGSKESCQGYRAQRFLDGQGVMVRVGE